MGASFSDGRFVRVPASAVFAGVFAFAAFLPPSAYAQQSTDMPAAVQPGWEVFVVRQETQYMRMDDPRPDGFGSIDMFEFETTLAYGLGRTSALMVHVPLMYWDLEDATPAPDAQGFGVDDITVMYQHRFYREDVGPIETRRAVLLTGLEVPSFDEGFSSESFDPLIGVAYTRIDGRHGLNASALWKFNTNANDDFEIEFGDSSADALKLDGSYLYRLDPEAYTAQTTGSHYFQAQALGRYETNGDWQVMFAPGWMYEGRQWAFEATVHLPVLQELDSRAELEWGVNLGVRYLF
ncbi:MAG: hypothetical protein AAF333_18500 [Planctomycetota bacterium]